MNDETPKAQIAIRAIRFWEKYIPNPATGEMQAEDWIEYCAPGQAASTTIDDAVKRVKRDKSGKWQSVEAAYKMWKSGEEMPESGTPLGAWPGINSTQAAVYKSIGIRTVEEVAAMTDTLLTRLKLPNPRALKEQASRFLEARSGTAIETAIKQRDDEIAALRSQMEDLIAMIGENASGEGAEKRGPGRPRKEQAAA